MRILFFTDSLAAGGKERRLIELMKELRLMPNINFELVLMNKEIHYKEVLTFGIKIHYLIRKTKKDISVFYNFYKICREYKPDIVHCWDSMTAIYLIPACKFLKIKIVNGMVTDTLVKQKQNISNKHWFRARLTFPLSDVIVGNSLAGLDSYKAPGNKSVCIYNGMDLLRFERLKEPSVMQKEIFGNISNNIFIIGMVAYFDWRKDYATLIKVAILLSSCFQNIRFILVGGGEGLDKIKESVPISLMNKIIFLGKRTDVESIINIFDVGVLLTNSKLHGEGISNSIIEYMALGKPVIATRGGGTAEVVIDDRNGFLIDPGNTGQLTEKISLLIENQTLINTLGNEGKKIVKERFDLKIMGKNFFELYKKIICL